MSARRVVLIIPRRRDIEGTKRLAYALEQIERAGCTLVAIVDPENFLEALGMVHVGLADVVVPMSPEDFPAVRFITDLNGERRTRPVLRLDSGPARDAARRPRLVEAEPAADDETDRTRPLERRPRIVDGDQAGTRPARARTQIIRRTA